VQGQIASIMERPPKRDLDSLRRWLKKPEFGNMFLLTHVEDVWDVERGHTDYLALWHNSAGNNSIVEQLSMLLLRLQRAIVADKRGKDYIYSLNESFRQTMASGILTAVASIFPVLPVVVLFFISRLLVRLALILVFTLVFASALVFGMQLHSDKVLAITTA
jgi:hypothetical protein